MEVVVLVASLKFFFIEGGEQFIVGIQTANKIGSKSTLKITIAGVSFAVILFFLLLYSRRLIPTRWLELVPATTLYFFAVRMLREVVEKEDEEKEFEEKAYKYGYATLVGLESVENATALAALTFVDMSGALVGAAISIVIFGTIAFSSKRLLAKLPLQQLKLVSGSLLALTATPLLVYSLGISAPSWFSWIIPPLQ